MYRLNFKLKTDSVFTDDNSINAPEVRDGAIIWTDSDYVTTIIPLSNVEAFVYNKLED